MAILEVEAGQTYIKGREWDLRQIPAEHLWSTGHHQMNEHPAFPHSIGEESLNLQEQRTSLDRRRLGKVKVQ